MRNGLADGSLGLSVQLEDACNREAVGATVYATVVSEGDPLIAASCAVGSAGSGYLASQSFLRYFGARGDARRSPR